MSDGSRYRLVYEDPDGHLAYGGGRSWPSLLRYLREMREDFGNLRDVREANLLRFPDPVERVR